MYISHLKLYLRIWFHVLKGKRRGSLAHHSTHLTLLPFLKRCPDTPKSDDVQILGQIQEGALPGALRLGDKTQNSPLLTRKLSF